MKRSLKRIVLILAAVMVLMTAATAIVSACTTIYVGGARNAEGTPFVCRTEDYGSDMNKMWFISEAGAFKQGSTYKGCPEYGGFEWTWTHDTYRFTYFTNDVIFDGKCPECGEGTPENPCTHYSYTEFGTNEKGVSVSATETIYGNDKVPTVDPFHDDEWMKENPGKGSGIEETDIPTVILGEAASAREGIELLMDIYETRGAFYASGLFVADQNEVWYIENCSGTQYVAMKLPDDLVFIEPNMAVIGTVDLDDPNVIASDALIKTAQEAESFVGNAEENVIDFRASYSGGLTRADSRLVQGLTYLNAAYQYTADDLVADNSIFTISNVGEGGAIVPIYTKIKEDRKLTTEDILGFYHLSTVGKPSNQEIEIFQLFKDRPVEYGTVGWVGVGDMSYGQFVPCYPLLLDSMYKGYQVPTAVCTRVTEAPTSGFFTARSSRWSGDYYNIYPENWKDSYYFSFEGLGNLVASAEKILGTPLTEKTTEKLTAKRDATQKELIADFISYDALKASADPRKAATENMQDMAVKAHEYALDAIDFVTASTKTPEKVAGVKAKNVKKQKVQVSWKKQEYVDKYQVQVALNKKFSKGKKTYTVKGTAASKKTGKLKKKTYFVRVRAYNAASETWGAWSAVKKVKVKK